MLYMDLQDGTRGRPGHRPTRDRPVDPERLLTALAGDEPQRLLHVHEVPERRAEHGDWPDWTEPIMLGALAGQGISRPWSESVQ